VDSERARERLSEERARVERELEAIGPTQVPDEPVDTGDAGVEIDQAERDEAIREELRRTLEAIERAEARLEEGTYGKSIISGEPIPDGRLEAIPWAERTVEEESSGGG
jgi:RNA polymerase-binding transcription factor